MDDLLPPEITEIRATVNAFMAADRHHGSLKLRDLRRDDVADELAP